MTEMIDVTEAIGVEVVFSMHKMTRAFKEDMKTLHGLLEGTMSLLLGLVNVYHILICELRTVG